MQNLVLPSFLAASTAGLTQGLQLFPLLTLFQLVLQLVSVGQRGSYVAVVKLAGVCQYQ